MPLSGLLVRRLTPFSCLLYTHRPLSATTSLRHLEQVLVVYHSGVRNARIRFLSRSYRATDTVGSMPRMLCPCSAHVPYAITTLSASGPFGTNVVTTRWMKRSSELRR